MIHNVTELKLKFLDVWIKWVYFGVILSLLSYVTYINEGSINNIEL